MEAEAIKEIEKLALQNRTVNVNGLEYSEKNFSPVNFEPRPELLGVSGLDSFCKYINENIDELDMQKHMVFINNEKRVSLISNLKGLNRTRDEIIYAELPSVNVFSFNKWMGQEEFAIGFRSLFVANENDDTNYVLKYVSKLTGGTTIETKEDGISQNVAIKRGVSGGLIDKTTLKPIVKLAPYRTFREVKQPESEFLLRVRLDNDEIPNIALFEADGGAWKIKAMKEIAEYISAKCPSINVMF